jgi:hypothetical protein
METRHDERACSRPRPTRQLLAVCVGRGFRRPTSTGRPSQNEHNPAAVNDDSSYRVRAAEGQQTPESSLRNRERVSTAGPRTRMNRATARQSSPNRRFGGTCLSRRRSRVRVPSLPFINPANRRICCPSRRQLELTTEATHEASRLGQELNNDSSRFSPRPAREGHTRSRRRESLPNAPGRGPGCR